MRTITGYDWVLLLPTKCSQAPSALQLLELTIYFKVVLHQIEGLSKKGPPWLGEFEVECNITISMPATMTPDWLQDSQGSVDGFDPRGRKAWAIGQLPWDTCCEGLSAAAGFPARAFWTSGLLMKFKISMGPRREPL
ncbi:hypothetical protein PG996_012801 [Apiospora saccharicola]|uniref:Uncharacterized protein n=1 Tax=Apiospora saccharicola TaxID=335842 RepID=A0ABR1U3N4_9PEZI